MGRFAQPARNESLLDPAHDGADALVRALADERDRPDVRLRSFVSVQVAPWLGRPPRFRIVALPSARAKRVAGKGDETEANAEWRRENQRVFPCPQPPWREAGAHGPGGHR